MGGFQRFARSFLAVREVDFLIVAASLLAALFAYALMTPLGGVSTKVPGLSAFGPLGALGVGLLLAFFGLPIFAGAFMALRPGEMPPFLARFAVSATLTVQSLVALTAAVMAFAYASLLLAFPQVASFYDLDGSAPWQLHVQRAIAVLVAARVLLTVALRVLHKGTPYTPGEVPVRVALACAGLAIAVVVAARLAGQVSSFALVDAWAVAGLAASLFRGPTQEA